MSFPVSLIKTQPTTHFRPKMGSAAPREQAKSEASQDRIVLSKQIDSLEQRAGEYKRVGTGILVAAAATATAAIAGAVLTSVAPLAVAGAMIGSGLLGMVGMKGTKQAEVHARVASQLKSLGSEPNIKVEVKLPEQQDSVGKELAKAGVSYLAAGAGGVGGLLAGMTPLGTYAAGAVVGGGILNDQASLKINGFNLLKPFSVDDKDESLSAVGKRLANGAMKVAAAGVGAMAGHALAPVVGALTGGLTAMGVSTRLMQEI